MPPDDPLGRHGPSLENFLRKRPVVPEHKKQPCPYGQYSKSMEKLICLYFKTSQHIKNIYSIICFMQVIVMLFNFQMELKKKIIICLSVINKKKKILLF